MEQLLTKRAILKLFLFIWFKTGKTTILYPSKIRNRNTYLFSLKSNQNIWEKHAVTCFTYTSLSVSEICTGRAVLGLYFCLKTRAGLELPRSVLYPFSSLDLILNALNIYSLHDKDSLHLLVSRALVRSVSILNRTYDMMI